MSLSNTECLLAEAAREAIPERLEDKVVTAVKAAGLLNHQPRENSMETKDRAAPKRPYAALAAAVAAIAIFAGGWQTGRLGKPATAPAVAAPAASEADAGATHALLLYDGARYRGPADEAQHRARVAEYTAWARANGAGDGARVVGGQELLGAVGQTGGGAALDKDRLGGFFLIRANTTEAALKLARTCPHAKYGGTVVVRAVGA